MKNATCSQAQTTYSTVAASQLSTLLRAMATTRDPNARARLYSHAMMFLGDLDRGFEAVVILARSAEKYDELLGLMAVLGVTIPDPETPLEIETERETVFVN